MNRKIQGYLPKYRMRAYVTYKVFERTSVPAKRQRGVAQTGRGEAFAYEERAYTETGHSESAPEL